MVERLQNDYQLTNIIICQDQFYLAKFNCTLHRTLELNSRNFYFKLPRLPNYYS